jgi:hypothetical protein
LPEDFISTDADNDLVLGTDGKLYVPEADLPLEILDEIVATDAQTSFTLTQTPIGAVKMTRNGVLLPKAAWTVSGTTVTYIPANNNDNPMHAGDRVEFFYEY